MTLRRPLVLGAALIALAICGAAHAEDAPVATISVTSATAGSSLGQLVEGVMRYRDQKILLTLHGVAKSVTTRGAVFGLQRPRDIEGTFRPVGPVLRNASGVTIRFDPPLILQENRLAIEISGGLQPKVSRGNGEEGVQ
jgi:hypothetical protein